MEFDANLGPYPLSQYSSWKALTNFITEHTINRLSPVDKLITSAYAEIQLEEEWRHMGARLNSSDLSNKDIQMKDLKDQSNSKTEKEDKQLAQEQEQDPELREHAEKTQKLDHGKQYDLARYELKKYHPYYCKVPSIQSFKKRIYARQG